MAELLDLLLCFSRGLGVKYNKTSHPPKYYNVSLGRMASQFHQIYKLLESCDFLTNHECFVIGQCELKGVLCVCVCLLSRWWVWCQALVLWSLQGFFQPLCPRLWPRWSVRPRSSRSEIFIFKLIYYSITNSNIYTDTSRTFNNHYKLNFFSLLFISGEFLFEEDPDHLSIVMVQPQSDGVVEEVLLFSFSIFSAILRDWANTSLLL